MSRVIPTWRPRVLHLEMAYRQSLGNGSGLSVFLSKLSIAGMVIAVAFLLASLSVMNGFEREMRLRILDLVPHVTIRSYLSETANKTLPIELGDYPTVRRSYRFTEKNALFSAGIDARVGKLITADGAVMQSLEAYLTPKLEQLGPGEVVLGKDLAESLDVAVGQSLVALVSEESGHRRFAPETLRLAAIMESGTEIDRGFALATSESPVGNDMGRHTSWAITITDPLAAPRAGRNSAPGRRHTGRRD